MSIANLCQAKVLDAVTVRPFNVSGVRQLGKGGFVLPRFVGQALLRHPLTVFGSGGQVRAFTDVPQRRQQESGGLAKGERGGIYNVGRSRNRTTIRELAELVIRVTNPLPDRIR